MEKDAYVENCGSADVSPVPSRRSGGHVSAKMDDSVFRVKLSNVDGTSSRIGRNISGNGDVVDPMGVVCARCLERMDFNIDSGRRGWWLAALMSFLGHKGTN